MGILEGDVSMKTSKINEWEKEVKNLNTRINNLKVWNDYAEMLQREYDQLLSERPKEN